MEQGSIPAPSGLRFCTMPGCRVVGKGPATSVLVAKIQAMTPGNGLTVREMLLADVGLRINYFHDASDDYLRMLGVERNLLPAPEEWHEFYEEDYARSIQERANYSLIWELDGEPVGFSSADQIVFGEEAFMHLHILDPAQ